MWIQICAYIEEVGFLVCKKEDVSIVQLEEAVEIEYRLLLINREISFLHILPFNEIFFWKMD
ncbi:hypothetical protein BACCIP111895_00935 [Neobacillus rhizosphaerae]|uniref:Uncharacterized protein n=1 Tax=Neobacillus rhizosphaerae TaxID=2880965 RepID=A0ABN8KNG5_9BACI|nr:hypothetical protein [Neobacillus rhizosphaerae]CAH2713781.1 hypothetical protein BACCIP111895_00935 [Neobacillus rhizosphaerae]